MALIGPARGGAASSRIVLSGLCVLAASLAWPADALAQRTRFDGLRQCERHAATHFRKRDAAFRRFIIDRSSVTEDRFAAQAGMQYVSSIYYGKAMYESGGGERTVRFICLHAGYRRGPVLVYTMPD